MGVIFVLAAYLLGVGIGLTLPVHYPTPWVGPVVIVLIFGVGLLAARLDWRR